MTNTMMTLDVALQDLITKTVAAAETAGGFVVAEVPIVVEQLLTWKFTISLLTFITGVLILLATIWGATYQWTRMIPRLKEKYAGYGDWDSDLFIRMVPCGFVPLMLMAASFTVACCNMTWLKIAIAPKLYLLEYAAELIK